NLGNGTGEEMMQLANHIISEVKKNFGVTLEPEVIVM
ncbi:MAG: UDP-N-acetylenolpyruvoylglucosamine reductase, partial [candidate division SR1 bacterium CG_4_9_14_3_um_filter_40_9]